MVSPCYLLHKNRLFNIIVNSVCSCDNSYHVAPSQSFSSQYIRFSLLLIFLFYFYLLKQCIMLESNALPRALDVAEFAAARVNEMKSLTFALSEASQGNRRAFQTLPKHLRRRTMSHDPKRIPRRLRGVAEREIAKDKNLEKQVELHAKRSRRIKRKAEKKASRLGNQEDREFKWLETHVWHAKRMKMENLWGFRMPMYPNDKGIRATNRASSIAAIHDASYLTCLQLSGTVNDIIRLMRHISNGSNVGNNMFVLF